MLLFFDMHAMSRQTWREFWQSVRLELPAVNKPALVRTAKIICFLKTWKIIRHIFYASFRTTTLISFPERHGLQEDAWSSCNAVAFGLGSLCNRLDWVGTIIHMYHALRLFGIMEEPVIFEELRNLLEESVFQIEAGVGN